MSALEAAVVAQLHPDGAAILDDVFDYLRRFVAYPSMHAQAAHTLWIAHTHFMDVWDTTPRIAFLSPEPGSGKSRALEVTELLVPNPVIAVNATPAYLFRKIGQEDGRPTVLFDEIDTVFGPKARDNEETRGLLNAGYRKHSVAGRCTVRGKEVFTEELPAYCAVAMAGLGSLPDTILTRSIIVRMRRRAPGERIEPYRQRTNGPDAERIRANLERWARSVTDDIGFSDMPEGVEDRNADVWEALIAVADAAGGVWPALARETAVTLVTENKSKGGSLGVQLLRDLRKVFGPAETMTTNAILSTLHAMDESPWADLKGKPLDARGLGYRLSQYGIHPTTVRNGAAIAKGYKRYDMHDAWSRYLPDVPQPASDGVEI